LIREAAASRLHSRKAGSVLPLPPPVSFPAKLLSLVPLTISARFYPGRIFESSAKPSASAFVRVNPVWPVPPWTWLRSSFHNSTRRKLPRFYPRSFPTRRIVVLFLKIQFTTVQLGFTLAFPLNWTPKFALLIQLDRDWLGFTLAAFSELTREVFLPDQSVRIVGALRKLGKRILTEALRKYVQDCAKVTRK